MSHTEFPFLFVTSLFITLSVKKGTFFFCSVAQCEEVPCLHQRGSCSTVCILLNIENEIVLLFADTVIENSFYFLNGEVVNSLRNSPNVVGRD